jgi:flagellar biogenesis protein FliO
MGSMLERAPARPRMLSVAERLDLGPKKSLLIVNCGEQRFLLASSAAGITAMLEISSPQLERRERRRPDTAAWRGRRC